MKLRDAQIHLRLSRKEKEMVQERMKFCRMDCPCCQCNRVDLPGECEKITGEGGFLRLCAPDGTLGICFPCDRGPLRVCGDYPHGQRPHSQSYFIQCCVLCGLQEVSFQPGKLSGNPEDLPK